MSEPQELNTTEQGRQTRLLILDTAEEICASLGFEFLSTRRVSNQARVNTGALNYHFGTKQQLLEELFKRRVEPVNAQRLALLDRLESEHPHGVPVTALVAAYLAPLMQLLGGAGADKEAGERYSTITQFIARAYVHPDSRRFFDAYYGPVRKRFLDALSRACPRLSRAELHCRYMAMIGSVNFMLGTADPTQNPLDGVEQPKPAAALDAATLQDWLVAFLAAGFTAEPSA